MKNKLIGTLIATSIGLSAYMTSMPQKSNFEIYSDSQLEKNESVYNMSDSVILTKSRSETKEILDKILKSTNPDFEDKITAPLESRIQNLYAMWQNTFSSGYEYKYRKHINRNLMDFDKMLESLEEKKMIEADCAEAVGFLLLNYQTYANDEEFKDLGINYFLVTTPSKANFSKSFLINSKNYNHAMLLINGEYNYIFDPSYTFQKNNGSRYDIKIDKFQMGKWATDEDASIVFLKNDSNEKKYPYSLRAANIYPINEYILYDMMHDLTIKDNSAFKNH